MGLWLVLPGHPERKGVTGGLRDGVRVDLERAPLPTLAASAGCISAFSAYSIEDDGLPVRRRNGDKPPYAIPPTAEILAAPSNGLTLASTFSGCGGSCLGYRWAGYDVAYACEIAPTPRASYEANFGSAPDPTDVRELTGERVLERLGIARGELDVLDGSPPCTAFSMAGIRDRGWRVEKEHGGKVQRVDDLFLEFGRLVDELQPRAFVAENVTGLVRGRSRPYFDLILRKLTETGYRVTAAQLDAEWLGVPQARSRIYILGVREDLGRDPELPVPLAYRYSVRDALPGLRLGTDEDVAAADISRYAIAPEWDGLAPGGKSEKYFSLIRTHPDRPAPTITAASVGAEQGSPVGAAAATHPSERRKFTIPELRRLCGFPDDFELAGSWGQQWAQLGNCVVPPMARAVGEAVAGVLTR